MSSADTLHERYRFFVADLDAALKANDAAAFRGAFERLREGMGEELMPELKRITASAQVALRRFRERARIDALAAHDVPDARKRLAHVVKLTEEAAHRTLDLVEKSGPLVDQTARDAAQLLEEWGAHGSLKHAAASLWPERAHDFLERTVADADRVRGHLSQMLLAQGYQDMTGQIIRSVSALVGELEGVLGQLVALANGEDTRRMPALRLPTAVQDLRSGVGPQVPGIQDPDAVSGQDDIDALLASAAGDK
jgi:chemotaxis protein CheZ